MHEEDRSWKETGRRQAYCRCNYNKRKPESSCYFEWQQVGGTAEQKIPYEVVCMLKALKNNQGTYSKAYVVLRGEG